MRDSVVHDIEIWHDRCSGKRRLSRSFTIAAHDDRFIVFKEGTYMPRMPESSFKSACLPAPLCLCAADGFDELERSSPRRADEHRVHKRRDRRRVADTGPAADDERVALRAIALPSAARRKIEHLQNIGIAHLVEQRKAEHIERAERPLRLERKERQPLRRAARPPYPARAQNARSQATPSTLLSA